MHLRGGDGNLHASHRTEQFAGAQIYCREPGIRAFDPEAMLARGADGRARHMQIDEVLGMIDIQLHHWRGDRLFARRLVGIDEIACAQRFDRTQTGGGVNQRSRREARIELAEVFVAVGVRTHPRVGTQAAQLFRLGFPITRQPI